MRKYWSPWGVGMLVFVGALVVIFAGGIALIGALAPPHPGHFGEVLGRVAIPLSALAGGIGYVVQWCRIP